MPDAKAKPSSGWSDWSMIPLFSVLHLALAIVLAILSFVTLSSPTWGPVTDAMHRTLIFPIIITKAWGIDVDPLWCYPNSLLYGLTWWFMWRMYRLTFRRQV